MGFFISAVVGNGLDAEGNQFRPALTDHGIFKWAACAYDGPGGAARVLVRCEDQPGFLGDKRIVPLAVTESDLRALAVPFQGKADVEAVAHDVTRRFLLRQYLREMDALDDMSLRFDDLSRAHRDAVAARLARYDLAEVKGSTLVGQALSLILPQVKVLLEPGRQRPSGTFTDNFNGEGSTVDLDAHTPSGGGAWTRIDGAANRAVVGTAENCVFNTTNGTGALYVCTDQADVDHYVQAEVVTTTLQGFICNRAINSTATGGFVGARGNTNYQIFKRDGAGLTQLASDGGAVSAGEVMRLESSGDAHELFVNGVSSVGPTNDAHNNTITRQGVNPRTTSSQRIDNFEAGVLVSGTVYEVDVAEGVTVQSADAAGAGQAHALAPPDAQTAMLIDGAPMFQAHGAAPADGAQGQAAGGAAAGQAHGLAAAGGVTAQILDAAAAVAVHGVTAADLAQLQALEGVTVLADGVVVVAPAEIVQAQAIDGVTATLAATLSPAAAAQIQALDAAVVSLVEIYTVAPAGMVQGQALAAVAVFAVHGLTAADLALVQASDAPAAGLLAALSPAGLAQAQAMDAWTALAALSPGQVIAVGAGHSVLFHIERPCAGAVIRIRLC